MKIKDLCEAERPRERLLSHGASALSNGELLAVLLRSGTASCSALDLAQELLRTSGGSLIKLSEMTVSELYGIPGIKAQKASTIMAAMELGRRFMQERSPLRKKAFVHARMVYDLMIPHLKGLRHEECWVIYLNRSNYLLDSCCSSIGGGSSTTIDIPMILRKALELHAAALILVHNHPSGNPRPGKADLHYTEELKKAATPFDISLLDHIVICDDCFYSYADECQYRA